MVSHLNNFFIFQNSYLKLRFIHWFTHKYLLSACCDPESVSPEDMREQKIGEGSALRNLEPSVEHRQ